MPHHLGQRGYNLYSYKHYVCRLLSMPTFGKFWRCTKASYRPAPTACIHLPEIHRAKTKLAPIRTITTTKNQQVLVQLGWAAKACPVPRACAISLGIARAPAASSSVPSGAAARSGQDSLSLLRPTSILPRGRLGVAP